MRNEKIRAKIIEDLDDITKDLADLQHRLQAMVSQARGASMWDTDLFVAANLASIAATEVEENTKMLQRVSSQLK